MFVRIEVLDADHSHAHAVARARAVAPPEAPYTPPLYSRILSAIVAFGPPVLLLFVIFRGTGGPVGWWEIAVAALFVVVIGHAVTIGFHRLFTHRSFVAKRPLKISLAVLGTMSFQGSLIGWVADHRRHHRFSERAGDPHSPWFQDGEPTGGVRGFWHAHIGWCFSNRPTSRTEYAPDLLADPDLVFIDKLFIPCCIATLALPFAIGYALYGTMAGAVGVLIWAGILRVGFTHNFTWMINSVCHRFGTAAVPVARPEPQLRAARAVHDGRVVAQRAPRVPAQRTPRRRAAPDRQLGRG